MNNEIYGKEPKIKVTRTTVVINVISGNSN